MFPAAHTPAMSAPDADPPRPHAILRWGGDQFALDVTNVQEVVADLPLTPLPRADPGWLGVGNLRGEILPVVSLQQWFAGTILAPVFVILGTPAGRLALAAESVAGVRSVPPPGDPASGEASVTGEPEFVVHHWQPPGEEVLVRCLDTVRLVQKLREQFVLSTLLPV